MPSPAAVPAAPDQQVPNGSYLSPCREDGRRRRYTFRCPRCRSFEIRVVVATGTEDAIRLRRRKCSSCDHAFFTAQEPEYLVRPERIRWVHGGMVLDSDFPEDL